MIGQEKSENMVTTIGLVLHWIFPYHSTLEKNDFFYKLSFNML
jgi:hypothetical protein